MPESLSTFTILSQPPGPQKLEVKLRYATRSDIPYIADVAAQAMLDDEWFEYVCPERRRHYTSFRDAFLRRTKQRFVNKGWCLIVAVASPSASNRTVLGDEGMGKNDANEDEFVLGYCGWERRGDDEYAERWKKEKEGLWNGV